MNNETVSSNADTDAALQKSSRRKLLIIFAMFGFPLLAATIYLQMVRLSGGNLGNTANGELVSPAVPMTEFSVATLDGESFNLDTLRGMWTLMYLPKGDCADVCQKNMYHMRQVRLLLNQRMNRLQRVVVAESSNQIPEQLLTEHPGLHVLNEPEAQLALIDQIEAAVKNMSPIEDVIYLYDPMGNLMMRFGPDIPPKKMLKDIKHLLKVSRIG